MKKIRPIILIDDDDEDLQLLKEAFKELKVENEILTFENGYQALAFLKHSDHQPYFILCDVNMNQFDGFDLRQEIFKDELLRTKSIPFLFLSTTGTTPDFIKAYNLSVQGYFKKPHTFEGIVKLLKCIMDYWGNCNHPNSEVVILK